MMMMNAGAAVMDSGAVTMDSDAVVTRGHGWGGLLVLNCQDIHFFLGGRLFPFRS